MTRVLQTVLLLTWSAAAVVQASAPALAGEPVAGAPPDLSLLTPPAGAKLVLKAHATGSQIYTCKAGADGGKAGADGAFQWVLKAPEADLHDKKGAVIGRHFAGPTWKHADGSEVTGKASVHVDSPDAASIPWLLVSATGHTGQGVFAKVSSIQRINTNGGKATGQCDSSKDGTESKSGYSADYLFYAAGK
jgi:Protein of unknown function (DUF3455)